jgi:hypothetical protein
VKHRKGQPRLAATRHHLGQRVDIGRPDPVRLQRQVPEIALHPMRRQHALAGLGEDEEMQPHGVAGPDRAGQPGHPFQRDPARELDQQRVQRPRPPGHRERGHVGGVGKAIDGPGRTRHIVAVELESEGREERIDPTAMAGAGDQVGKRERIGHGANTAGDPGHRNGSTGRSRRPPPQSARRLGAP